MLRAWFHRSVLTFSLKKKTKIQKEDIIENFINKLFIFPHYRYSKKILVSLKCIINLKPALRKKVIINIFSAHIQVILLCMLNIGYISSAHHLYTKGGNMNFFENISILYWLTLIRISVFIVYLNYIAFAHFYHLENSKMVFYLTPFAVPPGWSSHITSHHITSREYYDAANTGFSQ